MNTVGNETQKDKATGFNITAAKFDPATKSGLIKYFRPLNHTYDSRDLSIKIGKSYLLQLTWGAYNGYNDNNAAQTLGDYDTKTGKYNT